jgi:hypothetical protein
MERELWNKIYHCVKELASNKRPRCASFSDAQIVLTYFWSVLNNRSINWATHKCNWPLHMRRCRIPTSSTMTRRLPTESIQELLKTIHQNIIQQYPRNTCRWIDAKPLPIGGCSKDKDSSYGFGASCILRGYKLYAVADQNQGFIAWSVKAIKHNEALVARELIPQLDSGGYLIGDTAYDSDILYNLAAQSEIQLIAPRKRARALGHRKYSQHRLRSLQMQQREFGRSLLSSRVNIERMFGNLTTFIGGLGPLPHWVRTLFRVEMWVRAKMIFYHLWRDLRKEKKHA